MKSFHIIRNNWNRVEDLIGQLSLKDKEFELFEKGLVELVPVKVISPGSGQEVLCFSLVPKMGFDRQKVKEVIDALKVPANMVCHLVDLKERLGL